MAGSPCDFIISSFSKSSLEYLQKAFTTQSEQINMVVSDRNWLERENNIKSATLIRLNETNIEYPAGGSYGYRAGKDSTLEK